jgi:hypothetical protein
MLPSLAFSAMEWTYRLNAFDVGCGIDLTDNSVHRVVADATGELLSVAIGANANSDWGIAVGATLLRATATSDQDIVGAALFVGPCVTNGVGSSRSRAIPVFTLSGQVGYQAVLAELRAEWGIGIIRPGIRIGGASYFFNDTEASLAPFIGVYVGLGGWGAFTNRGGGGWGG